MNYGLIRSGWHTCNKHVSAQNDVVPIKWRGALWFVGSGGKHDLKWLCAGWGSNVLLFPDFLKLHHCSWAQIPRRTVFNQIMQTIYRSLRLSSYINNIPIKSPNSYCIGRIEHEKVWHQKFKSRFLSQILMNLNSTSCIALSKQRSTRTISQF